MEAFLRLVESEAPALRALTAKRLAALDQKRAQEKAAMKAGSGILWGWKEIADYARIGEDKAKSLAADPRFPLPVFRDGKGLVQSTRAAIDQWADQRAMAGLKTA